MSEPLHVAVDLGAGSGRVFLAGVGEDELLLQEVRRFQYPPSRAAGHLRWDLPRILDETVAGVREAGIRARELDRAVYSVGVDGWGVDYGLLDSSGALVENPVSYRDERTRGVMDDVFSVVPRAEIFARTGIQLLDFNTIYQLRAHVREGLNPAASRLLLVPDLLHFFLCGRAATEYTNATTTQLVNARTRTWDPELLDRLSLPSALLSPLVPAGTDLGALGPPLSVAPGLVNARVVAPATHDTGSAVAGAPLEPGWAYISSGTWSLVGLERREPLLSEEAARHNLSNEGGAFSTFRLLKNVMGLWILESCRKEWREQGRETNYERLLAAVGAFPSCPAVLFPDDARLFNPPSMLQAMALQLSETGQRLPEDPPAVARMVLDSLALRYASVLRMLALATGERIAGVHIVGGGTRNHYLNQATADRTGLPVRAGPVESTVIGNVLVQAVGRGRFASLEEARLHVAARLEPARYVPRPGMALDEAARRYAGIEARFVER